MIVSRRNWMRQHLSATCTLFVGVCVRALLAEGDAEWLLEPGGEMESEWKSDRATVEDDGRRAQERTHRCHRHWFSAAQSGR